MGLIFRSSSLANTGSTQIKGAPLTFLEGDGNFAWLATNLSGSVVSISGSTTLTGNLTVTSGITGSLFGTASFVLSSSFANTASFALTASYALNAGSTVDTGSFVTTSSFNNFTSSIQAEVNNLTATTASYVTNAQTSSMSVLSSSFALTASYALNAESTLDTGSFVTTSSFNNFTGSIQSEVNNLTAATASYITSAQTSSMSVLSASYALTASYALNAGSTVDTSSFVTTSSFNNFTGSIQNEVVSLTAATASYITSAQTSSMSVLSSSYALTASYALNGGAVVDTGSFVTTSSFDNFTGSIQSQVDNLTAATASYIISAQTSSMSVLSASFATTASYAEIAQTASYVVNAESASLATTASYAENAATASFFSGSILNAISASYALTASYLSGNLPDVGFNFTQSVPSSTWTVQHNLNTLTPLVQVYDDSYSQIIPASISSSDANTTAIAFSSGRTGYAIVSKGSGFTAFASSASLASTASYIAPTAIGYNHVQSVSSDTWTINHNLNNQYPLVQVYDSNSLAIIPQSISGSNTNTLIVTFSSPRTGYVRVI